MATKKGYAVVVHGGAGEPLHYEDGCKAAADAAVLELTRGKQAIDAAVAAVVSLENDGRFNAGTGAILALDGETINLDACVMDSCGVLGAVSSIKYVKNPVLVARDVSKTPHVALACDGATQFARIMGHRFYYAPTQRAYEMHCEMIEKVRQGEDANNQSFKDFETYWNFIVPVKYAREIGCDTVGAVVRDAEGRFAVAGSTGGSAPTLLGRVGDTCTMGSGFYAGPAGAVACTGVGEEIIRRIMAFRVYQWIEGGMPVPAALRKAVDEFPDDIDFGIIAVSQTESGADSNQPMPQALREAA